MQMNATIQSLIPNKLCRKPQKIQYLETSIADQREERMLREEELRKKGQLPDKQYVPKSSLERNPVG